MSEVIEIDINCDMGESYGRFQVGNDELLLPYITRCNIACGFHGGDPYTIELTIDLALEQGVVIGAHPSYPDLSGFGRRYMSLSPAELSSSIKYQVSALKSLVESKGEKLSHVKPHGALYNQMAENQKEALIVIQAVKEIDPELPVMILSGSVAQTIAVDLNQPYIREAFVDRRYVSATRLKSRTQDDAVINNPATAVCQLRDIALDQRVGLSDGEYTPLVADSFCIHGDNPSALEIVKYIYRDVSAKGSPLKITKGK